LKGLGLTPIVIKEIFRVIPQINKEGVTILLVEQNVKMALTVADCGCVLDGGKILPNDSVSKLVENEFVQRAFLG